MATIKAFIDLEQSKKLAEILPLESVDMYYDRYEDPDTLIQQRVDALADIVAEQKPTDKVEPKFHKGEWVVRGKTIAQILDVQEQYYVGLDIDGNDFTSSRFLNDDKIHLWTIQDAKDGDVLFQDLMGGKTFIYNGINPDMAILYSYIISNDGEDILPYHIGKPNTGIGNIEENKNIIHPATKEQRNLLFQKMKETGYKWDAEKKELKKIVVPIFNIGDTIVKKHNSDIRDFGSFTITDITGGKYWYNDRIICDITRQNEWEPYEPVRQKPA